MDKAASRVENPAQVLSPWLKFVHEYSHFWCYNTQHNDIQHDDIQHNDTRNYYAECPLCWVSFMLSIANKSIAKSVIMLNISIMTLSITTSSLMTLDTVMLIALYAECHSCWASYMPFVLSVLILNISIMTLSIMTFRIMTFSITTFSLLTLETVLLIALYAECHSCWA